MNLLDKFNVFKKEKPEALEASQRRHDLAERRLAPGEASASADATLESESEVKRLSKYIDPAESKKIIDTRSALKHGVNKIGTIGDPVGALDFLQDAHKHSKVKAAKILSDLWADKNLIDIVKTKSGKELVGKIVSKNVYIKEVSYLRKGKTISYLQARSTKTGRVVPMRIAKGLLSKRNK